MLPTKEESQSCSLYEASSDLQRKAVMRVMKMTEDECAYILELLDSEEI